MRKKGEPMKVQIVKLGVFKRCYSDRDYGPCLVTNDGEQFDPDEAWKTMKEGTKVKATIILEEIG